MRCSGVIRKEIKIKKKKKTRPINNSYNGISKTRKLWNYDYRTDNLVRYKIGEKNRLSYFKNRFKWKKCKRSNSYCKDCGEVLGIFSYNSIKLSYFVPYLKYKHKISETDFLFEKKKQERNVSDPFKGRPKKEKFYLGETNIRLFEIYSKNELVK